MQTELNSSIVLEEEFIMLQVKVIGIGAAGNKAANKLIEDKVVQ